MAWHGYDLVLVYIQIRALRLTQSVLRIQFLE